MTEVSDVTFKQITKWITKARNFIGKDWNDVSGHSWYLVDSNGNKYLAAQMTVVNPATREAWFYCIENKVFQKWNDLYGYTI